MKIGDKVIVLGGDTGKIVSQDECTLFWFVLLDKDADDIIYRHLEHGPFANGELEVACK